ncbi:inositol monophosphatase family protein [Nesterenkonia sp. NBAIMH1]|uniref:inositol monophosphatase family protein n=1 Tax=Nesterenkonia sp. NBAIMH1 TaxID=2600320 RepID=UPI0011B642AD|nr:inositol monophosphatase family protein [Nesterenkonia sp. NBAIMH1]
MSTDLSTLNELLKIAGEAARAGADVLAGRAQTAPAGIPLTAENSGLETKTSAADFVTDFDKKAEDAVRNVITSYRPHDVISGEEYGTTEVADPSGYRWSIDPLDGTTNFVRGIAYYGTSVGLQAPDGAWIVGVVDAPALQKMWWASAGQGAWTASYTSEPVRMHGPSGELSAGLLASGFAYDAERREEQAAAVTDMLAQFGNMRRLGAAALDICMVAEGTMDAYAEYGIQEHDWAAAAVIAEEAGTPMRRPAHVNGNEHPDWTIAGNLGVPHDRLRPRPEGL